MPRAELIHESQSFIDKNLTSQKPFHRSTIRGAGGEEERSVGGQLELWTDWIITGPEDNRAAFAARPVFIFDLRV